MTPRTISTVLLSLALALGCSGKKDGDSGKKKPAQNDPSGQKTPPAGNGTSKPTNKQPKTPPPKPTYKPLASDPGGAAGKVLWANRLGGQAMDVARGVAMDKDGNVAVTGYLSEGADFGDGKPVEARQKDVYVAKYGADGKLMWSATFGSAKEDGGYDVAFDGAGNVIVVGLFSGEMTVGESKVKATGSDDVFFAKFAPDGKPMWARHFGGPDSDVAYGVTARPNGHAIVTGSFKGTVEIPDGQLESKGNEDVFVLELDDEGGLLWAKRFGERHEDYGQAVAVDDAGHILVIGEFAGEASFGGPVLKSVGNQDIYLLKLTPAGEHVWSRQFGGAFNELGMGLDTDPAGNIAISGSFDNQIKFGEDTLASQGESDVFVAKFTSDGEYMWSRAYGGSREDIGQNLGMDSYGNVIVGGIFWNTINFGGEALTANGANRDAFLVKLAADGKHVWSMRMGDKDHDRLRGVAVGKDGKIAAAGIFRFALDLGMDSGPLQSARKPDDKAPPSDVFVAVFDR